ncbi:MAG: type II toxin-antitoxin system Phd/YefM family antitoxin [Desulfobacterales bacterium]
MNLNPDIPKWKRTVRNVLQYRKKTGEIEWDGDAHYLLGDEEIIMISINASEAQSKLHDLIEETGLSHKPVIISGNKSNAVLISEDDWESIQETSCICFLYRICVNQPLWMKTPVKECTTELTGKWELVYTKTGSKDAKKIIFSRSSSKGRKVAENSGKENPWQKPPSYENLLVI